MTPYRSPARAFLDRLAPRETCETCGLQIVREPIPDGLSFAQESVFVLTRTTLHGFNWRCPGPPRLALVPWWRALWEFLT